MANAISSSPRARGEQRHSAERVLRCRDFPVPADTVCVTAFAHSASPRHDLRCVTGAEHRVMLQMFRDLLAHKGYANAALLAAVRPTAAAADPELGELLHHTLLANRFWLLSILESPFVFEQESQPAPSFDALVQRYARTQSQESAWIERATEADLARVLVNPLIPNGSCSVAEALMQVCLHSHGHRAQAAKLLRRHGGTPPATDFILWLASRAVATWPDVVDPTAESNAAIGAERE